MTNRTAILDDKEGAVLNALRLPGQTHIGYVNLQVSNLHRSLEFYSSLVGMKKAIDLGPTVVLSASGRAPYHIILTERPGARPKPPRTSGLYHIAIRYPNRRELAKVFRRLYNNNAEFQGFSDHLVSEAIYLADPDDNGVELYVDRPRVQWEVVSNQIQMATLPLNLESLLKELHEEDADTDPIDSRSDIGHVHLHVSDLRAAEEFYNRLLGFDVTQRSYPGALFLSAGGYHHHIGVNVWAGRGVPPPPDDAAGLLSFGISLPDPGSVKDLAERFEKEGTQFEIRNHQSLHTEVLRIKSPDALDIEFFSSENKQ